VSREIRWSLLGLTMAAAADGDAYGIVEGNQAGQHYFGTKIEGLRPGEPHLISAVFKPVGKRGLQMAISELSPPGRSGSINCGPNVKSSWRSGEFQDQGLEELEGGWFLCWGSIILNDREANLGFSLSDGPYSTSYVGDGRSGLFIRQVKIHEGRRPVLP